jgi:hypothetical protein
LNNEIGLTKAVSRQEGIRTDAQSLAKVKAWLHADMGGSFEDLYHHAVDCLDRVTVCGVYSHGDTSLADCCSLPLVCIGDAQRNIGLGGGGNLALQDSTDLAVFLCGGDPFDASSGLLNMQALHEVEGKMLKRKTEFHEVRKKHMEGVLKTRQGDIRKSSISIADLAGGNRLMAGMIRLFAGISRLAYAWECRWGLAGSVPGSHIFSNVRQLLRLAGQ